MTPAIPVFPDELRRKEPARRSLALDRLSEMLADCGVDRRTHHRALDRSFQPSLVIQLLTLCLMGTVGTADRPEGDAAGTADWFALVELALAKGFLPTGFDRYHTGWRAPLLSRLRRLRAAARAWLPDAYRPATAAERHAGVALIRELDGIRRWCTPTPLTQSTAERLATLFRAHGVSPDAPIDPDRPRGATWRTQLAREPVLAGWLERHDAAVLAAELTARLPPGAGAPAAKVRL